jgi:FkbM family methyltransferase
MTALSNAIRDQDPHIAEDTLRVGAIGRFVEAILWRRRIATERAFVARNFRDGEAVYAAYKRGESHTRVTLADGRDIVHPDRFGLVPTLIELWHHRGYTQGLYRPRHGDVVVDAGANVGVFSAFILRTCPSVRVLPIEPAQENLPYLRENLATFGGDVQDLTAAALGPKAGVAHFQIAERSLDHRVVENLASASEDRTVRVPVVTLEDVLAKARVDRVALLKLDIESAEYALLDTISDATLARFDRIAIEPHPKIAKRSDADLIRRLQGQFDVRWYGPLLQAKRR